MRFRSSPSLSMGIVEWRIEDWRHIRYHSALVTNESKGLTTGQVLPIKVVTIKFSQSSIAAWFLEELQEVNYLPQSCSRAMKVVGVVDATCEALYELVMGMDDTRYEWDCNIHYGSLVEEVDGHTAIIYHRLQLHWFPMFVWPCDLCYVRYWCRNDDDEESEEDEDIQMPDQEQVDSQKPQKKSKSTVTLDLLCFFGTLHRDDRDTGHDCWSIPDANNFQVRSKHLSFERSKVPAGQALMHLVVVDWVKDVDSTQEAENVSGGGSHSLHMVEVIRGRGQGQTSMTHSLKESISKSLSVVITELRLLRSPRFDGLTSKGKEAGD
eukprot:Gb_07652 [translate_table: standard]